MRELLSKLVAGGLSAAVILLWWPRFFPADSATTWLIRGVIWTLSSELLLHAVLPLERALWDSRPGRRVASKASDRLGSRRRSLRARASVACAALSVPAVLLTLAPAPPAKPAAASVRHVTEVKRIVRVERKQVRVAKVVPVPAPARPAPVADPAIASERPRAAKPVARTPARAPRGGSSSPAERNGATAPDTGSTGADTGAPQPAQQQPVDAPRVVHRSASA